MTTNTLTTYNMDTLLAQILKLHDSLLSLEDNDLSPMQKESTLTMQELSTRLCTLWITDEELSDLSTEEKGILRHDFMNPLHGIIGFSTLMLRDVLTPDVGLRIQTIKTLAKTIERSVTIITKGLIPEMVE